jgi:hypothetical protein
VLSSECILKRHRYTILLCYFYEYVIFMILFDVHVFDQGE